MIKKYIEKLFGRRERVTHKDAKPVIHGRDKHDIRKEHISKCARRTCEELQRAGYAAGAHQRGEPGALGARA